MDVKALSYYVAIADQKSINKAAEILYISQPVLSRTVQALEDELGVQLLIRNNHGIEMTPVGQSLYYYAHSILSQFEEIERLKEIKRQQIIAGADDIVELQMRIAFGDIGNYVTFGQKSVPVMAMYGPVQIENKETGEKETLMKDINVVQLNESDRVDTQIIQEVKEGRNGVSVKLADKQKAIDWLTKFFEMNPDDRHRKEFDKRKLDLELLKLEMQTKDSAEDAPEQDNFLDALNSSAKEVWSDD